MTPRQAHKIRFGILAARSTFHGLDRLTPDQADYLEDCEPGLFRSQIAVKAFEVTLRNLLLAHRSPTT